MTAGAGLPLDLQDSLATLQAILNVVSGIPGATAVMGDGPWMFPQVGFDPDAALPNGDTAANALAKITYDLISIVGQGKEELRKRYDADVSIPGDTYEPNPDDPDERLGGVIESVHGPRLITVQIKCESWVPNVAEAAVYLERVRTRLRLPSVSTALEDKGMSIASLLDSKPADYTDDSGRMVSCRYFEVVFNAADYAEDDAVTTIETVDKPEQVP